MPVYGDGLNVRDWLYVEDHARALTLVLERGNVGSTYNIGSRSERANKDVANAVCDLLDEIQPSPRGSRLRVTSQLIQAVAFSARHLSTPVLALAPNDLLRERKKGCSRTPDKLGCLHQALKQDIS
jgi:nucleoside-diphosphate-sugar epimerase